MKISEIIKNYINQKGDNHSREIGRYWASDIYSIVKGELTPENFFEKKIVDEFGVRCMSSGIAMEDFLSKVFKEMEVDYIPQPKKEIQIQDFVLVVKPDFQFPDFIVEVKSPRNLHDDIPVWWTYQLECEYRAFYLPVYLWQVYHPFSIKQIAFTPNKNRWNKICKVLTDFHKELKKKYDQKIHAT